MSRRLITALIALFFVCLAPVSASAVTISYTSTFLGNNEWRNDYNLATQAGDPTVRELTIYFDRNLYSNLRVAASPPDWDSLVAQPAPAIPADGFFDSLSLNGGLPPGALQDGFSVLFTFLGVSKPGNQLFEIVDPETFATLAQGLTHPLGTLPADVPEPNTPALGLVGLAVLLLSTRRFSRKRTSATRRPPRTRTRHRRGRL